MECCNSVKIINVDKNLSKEEIKEIFKEICNIIINIKKYITVIHYS